MYNRRVDDLRIHHWQRLTQKAFDAIDRERAVVLLTCSPLEVHGPHLPLGADILEGEGLVRRTLRFLPERHRDRDFIELPCIYAATDTVPQPGSLYFHPSTTVKVLVDLGRTLAKQGFRNVFISNFHGGPRHFLAIEKACARANRRYGRLGLRMVSVFSLMLGRLPTEASELGDVLGHLPSVSREELAGDTHAGVVETSQLLALHGDLIDPDYKALPRQTVDTWLTSLGEEPRAAPTRGLGRIAQLLRGFRSGLAYFGENTYAGAPASGSAELGEHFLDTLGGHAAEACAELLDGTLSPKDCHSPLWPLRFAFLNPAMIRLSNHLLGFRNPIR